MIDYGKLVQKERNRKMYSLVKLSEMSGIAATTINSWENHGRIPPADKLDRVLAALEVSIVLGKKVMWIGY